MGINYIELRDILERKANKAIKHLDELKCFVPEFREVLDSVLYISETLQDLNFLDTECPDCKKVKIEVPQMPVKDELVYVTNKPGNWNPNRLVLFFSETCEPCQYLKPIIEELGEELNIQVEYISMDTVTNEEHARTYRITGWPTLFILRNNRIVATQAGYDLQAGASQNKQRYYELIMQEYNR
jgi:thioredoxin 1